MIEVNLETDSPYISEERTIQALWIKWMGRLVCQLREKLDPLSFLVNTLAYCLFPLAARCVVSTSSRSFKRRCQAERVENSRQVLRELGGEEVTLNLPSGHAISAMYVDAKRSLEALLAKGAERGSIEVGEGALQEVLWIPANQPEFEQLIEKMGMVLCYHEDRPYLALGVSKLLEAPADCEETLNAANELDDASASVPPTPGTVIYAPGSGHLFEFRRKTIGTFVLGYGMNMLLLNYSGTGRSGGSISEEATYEDMEAAYQYLREKEISDESILGYGHCMGGGPVLDLAKKHPINVLADRTYPTMGEFAALRVKTVLRLPSFLSFLISWVKPVMNKCFHYDNRENIKQVRGNIAVLGAAHDEIIPPNYIQQLFENATSAKSRVQFFMDTNHDRDLCCDEDTRLKLGRFLTESRLIGY